MHLNFPSSRHLECLAACLYTFFLGPSSISALACFSGNGPCFSGGHFSHEWAEEDEGQEKCALKNSHKEAGGIASGVEPSTRGPCVYRSMRKERKERRAMQKEGEEWQA